MRKSTYQKLTTKNKKNWTSQKKKEWSKNADFWIKIIRENLDPYREVVTNKAILNLIKKEKNSKILDAGCGEGYLCRLAAKIDKSNQIFGIDLSLKLIKTAKDLEKQRPLGIKYSVGDFRKTDFPSSFFDVIFSHQTIHEVPNPEKAIKEFFRILKKDGKLILLFLHPCFEVDPKLYFEPIKIKKSSYLVSGIKSPSAYFYLHLPLSRWIEILENNGFLIKRIDEPHPPLELMKKDEWWKENFQKPMFILIEGVKV
ncbi:MAG TPA: class I SAM-dependent methyltransferase [Candidatus Pacearchaeota archaeon]|nr:class I SAM-dependent methyltransferase [Candidatus Pacearchaeota archaeon]HOK94241.1 class I SAM-dependent methyltransferase [Candidatus Pacearchaeota archaeon]HPO75355.1 class I SAM-dependent methyltransferase [Candidatus Pacearchaeota archaeon]